MCGIEVQRSSKDPPAARKRWEASELAAVWAVRSSRDPQDVRAGSVPLPPAREQTRLRGQGSQGQPQNQSERHLCGDRNGLRLGWDVRGQDRICVTLTPAAKPPGEGRTLSWPSQCPTPFTSSHGSLTSLQTFLRGFLPHRICKPQKISNLYSAEGRLFVIPG